MNYFAHALPFLSDPCFAAGTAVPDWLSVSDRQCRLRSRHVEPLTADADPAVASLAGGALQHLRDDARFHATLAFAETSVRLSAMAREVLEGESGLRLGFLGHLLAEVLLDASLAAEFPAQLEQYYRLLDGVDAAWVEATVNRAAPRRAERLAVFIAAFRRERILWDYLEDAKLMVRLNQVMRRVGLAPLTERFGEILPAARALVAQRRGELLEGIPAVARSAA